MKRIVLVGLLLIPELILANELPAKYTDLLKFVQPAPDQGESNTCWFVASTGAMELLLNKRDQIIDPQVNGPNDLSESFLIWQKDYRDSQVKIHHFIEEMVQRFNHGEAIQNIYWPFNAYNEDGTDSLRVWNRHPEFYTLPRVQVPKIKTEFLFARGRKWATYVLKKEDVQTVKEALVKYESPIIINYNEDGYWHVVLIVGYDDTEAGECYELEENDCPEKGAFYVRDSNGTRYELRNYNWFLYKANAAAVVELR